MYEEDDGVSAQVEADNEWLPEPDADVDEKPSEVKKTARSFISNLRVRPPPLKPKTKISKEDQPNVDGEPSDAPTSKEVQKQPFIARPPGLAVPHSQQVLPEQIAPVENGGKSGDNKGKKNVQSQLNPIPHHQSQAEKTLNCATPKQVCRQAATQPTPSTPKRKRSQEPKENK